MFQSINVTTSLCRCSTNHISNKGVPVVTSVCMKFYVIKEALRSAAACILQMGSPRCNNSVPNSNITSFTVPSDRYRFFLILGVTSECRCVPFLLPICNSCSKVWTLWLHLISYDVERRSHRMLLLWFEQI
jgi:hypothetical protein